MGLVTVHFDAAGLVAEIAQVGEKAVKHALDEMRNEGEEMAELARHYAPHDKGKLEAAIKSEDADGGRDEGGRRMRKTVQVYVDQDMPGSGGAETVGQYAFLMHEELGPYGSGTYQARKGTTSKGPQAGGKFLERAVEDRRDTFYARIARRFSRFFK